MSIPAEARGGHQVSCVITLFLILLRKGQKVPEILLSLPGPTALSNKHTCDHSEVFYMGTGIHTWVLNACAVRALTHRAVALVCHVPFFLSALLSLNQLSLVNLISGWMCLVPLQLVQGIPIDKWDHSEMMFIPPLLVVHSKSAIVWRFFWT